MGNVWPGRYKSTWGGDSSGFCHSAKCSVFVCLIYSCLSLLRIIKPCQMLSQRLIRVIIKVSSSLVCVFLPALATSRAGIHTAFVLFAWGRSTLSQLLRELTVRIASTSRCGHFLSLRREPSPAFPASPFFLPLPQDPAPPPRVRKHASMERILPPNGESADKHPSLRSTRSL